MRLAAEGAVNYRLGARLTAYMSLGLSTVGKILKLDAVKSHILIYSYIT